MEIHKATKGDMAQILAWHNATWEDHRARQPRIFRAEKSPIVAMLRRQFSWGYRLSQRTSCDLRLLRVKDQNIGYILISRPRGYFGKPSQPHCATIFDIYVVPEFRNRGLGRFLLENAQTTLTSEGVVQIEAIVWAGNSASKALFSSVFSEVYTKYTQESAAAQD